MKDSPTNADYEYIQNFRATAIELLNQSFGEIQLRKRTTRDEKEIRKLNDANVPVWEHRQTFYEVTGIDRMANCSSERLILNKWAVPQTLLIIYNSFVWFSFRIAWLSCWWVVFVFFFSFLFVLFCFFVLPYHIVNWSQVIKQVIYLSHVWRHNRAMHYIFPNISWRF